MTKYSKQNERMSIEYRKEAQIIITAWQMENKTKYWNYT